MTHFRWLLWLCQPFISPAIQMKMQLYGEPMKCKLNGWLTCTDLLSCSYALLLFTYFPALTPLWIPLSLTSRPNSFYQPHPPSCTNTSSSHLTFFQTNTCKFSLTENTKTKPLQPFLQLNKKVPKRVTSPQRKRGFSTVLNTHSLWESQRHNTAACSCRTFCVLKWSNALMFHTLLSAVRCTSAEQLQVRVQLRCLQVKYINYRINVRMRAGSIYCFYIYVIYL